MFNLNQYAIYFITWLTGGQFVAVTLLSANRVTSIIYPMKHKTVIFIFVYYLFIYFYLKLWTGYRMIIALAAPWTLGAIVPIFGYIQYRINPLAPVTNIYFYLFILFVRHFIRNSFLSPVERK
jgi:hypothetical protein